MTALVVNQRTNAARGEQLRIASHLGARLPARSPEHGDSRTRSGRVRFEQRSGQPNRAVSKRHLFFVHRDTLRSLHFPARLRPQQRPHLAVWIALDGDMGTDGRRHVQRGANEERRA